LPVHILRLHCAIEVLATASFDDAAGHYKFEGNITGYYADPGSKEDARIKAGNTQTTAQFFFAPKHIRFERTLTGNNRIRPQSRVFIDGEYTFPESDTRSPGYIDCINISYNSTNRPGAAFQGTVTSGGCSRRRDLQLKPTPTTPGRGRPKLQRPPISSQSSLSTPSTTTVVATSPTLTRSTAPVIPETKTDFPFEEYLSHDNNGEGLSTLSPVDTLLISGLGSKRAASDSPTIQRPKRQRKLTEKAKGKGKAREMEDDDEDFFEVE
jgi:hypothetical protein